MFWGGGGGSVTPITPEPSIEDFEKLPFLTETDFLFQKSDPVEKTQKCKTVGIFLSAGNVQFVFNKEINITWDTRNATESTPESTASL